MYPFSNSGSMLQLLQLSGLMVTEILFLFCIQPLKYGDLSESLSYATLMQTQQFCSRRICLKIQSKVEFYLIHEEISVKYSDI